MLYGISVGHNIQFFYSGLQPLALSTLFHSEVVLTISHLSLCMTFDNLVVLNLFS